MKVKPLNDGVLVKQVEEAQVTKGGIVIPDSSKEKPIEGKVIAVGPGKFRRWSAYSARTAVKSR